MPPPPLPPSAMSPQSPRATQARDYWCFISYRHADDTEHGRQWATWLHEALETYEVPQDLVGTRNDRGDIIPSRIYPVFRDIEELPADADLSAPILAALERSRFLIVICSPSAVASRFVNEEIRLFKKLGHSSRVLAMMIRGEPNVADDEAKRTQLGFSVADECFPLSLRRTVDAQGDTTETVTEPIASDFRWGGKEEGWTTLEHFRAHLLKDRTLTKAQIDSRLKEYGAQLEREKLKLVAGVLGVPLGVLTKRDQRHQLMLARKRAAALRRWLVLVGGLAVLALLATWFAVEKKKLADAQLVAASRANHAVAERLLREAVSTDDPEKTGAALAHLEQAIAFDPTNEAAIKHSASVLMHRELPRHPIVSWPDSYASFSASGAKVLVEPEGKPAWVYDVETGTSLGELPVAGEVDGWLAGSEGTLRVSCDDRHTLVLWTPGAEVPLVTVTRRWNGFTQSSADGSLLAVGLADPHEVVTWSVSMQRLVGEPMQVPHPVKGIAFDPVGSLFAVNVMLDEDHREIRRFDLKTRQAVGPAWPLPPKVFFMTWPSAKVMTGSNFDQCYLFDPATGKALRDEPLSSSSEVNSHDGLRQAFGDEGLQVLDLTTGELHKAQQPVEGSGSFPFMAQASKISGLTFTPDDQFLVGVTQEIDPSALMGQRQDKTAHALHLWDAKTLEPVGEKRMLGAEYDYAFTPDGRWIIVQNSKQELIIRDAKTWQPMGGVLTAPGDIFTIKPSPDGRTLLVTSKRGSVITSMKDVQLWSLADAASPGDPVQPPEAEAQLKKVPAWRHLPAKDAESTRIAVVADMGAEGGPEAVGRTGEHPDDLADLGGGPFLDGAVQSAAKQIVTFTTSGELRVWNYETQALVFGPVKHEDIDDAGPTSADGRYVAFCYPDKQSKTHVTEVWDMRSNTKVAEWRPIEDAKWKAAFDTASKRVLLYPATSWLGGVPAETVILDLHDLGRPLMRLRPLSPNGSQPDVIMASWLADQRTIVLACKDMTVRLFDAATGVPVSEPIAAWSNEPRYELSADERWLTTFRPIGGHRVELPTVRTPPPPGLLSLVSMRRVSDTGALRRLSLAEWGQARQSLSDYLKTLPTDDSWRRIAEWTLAHSWSRTISPHHEQSTGPWLSSYIPKFKGTDQQEGMESVLSSYAASLPPEMQEQVNSLAMREIMQKMASANQDESGQSFARALRRLDPGHPLFPLVDALNAERPATQAHLLRIAGTRLAKVDRETAALGASLLLDLQDVAKPATTLSLAETMLAAQPSEPNALLVQGRALLALNRPKDALRSFTQLRKAQPLPSANVFAPLSALLWVNGDKAEAVVLLRALFEADSETATPEALLDTLPDQTPESLQLALMEVARAATRE